MFLGEIFQGFLELASPFLGLGTYELFLFDTAGNNDKGSFANLGQDFILRCEIFLAFGRIRVRFPVLDEQIVRGVQNFLSCGIMGAFL